MTQAEFEASCRRQSTFYTLGLALARLNPIEVEDIMTSEEFFGQFAKDRLGFYLRANDQTQDALWALIEVKTKSGCTRGQPLLAAE